MSRACDKEKIWDLDGNRTPWHTRRILKMKYSKILLNETSACHERRTKWKIWDSDGNRTLTSRTLVGRSNHWATGGIVASYMYSEKDVKLEATSYACLLENHSFCYLLHDLTSVWRKSTCNSSGGLETIGHMSTWIKKNVW